jgi:tetratricopeptide (TPR) repeat protein
MSPARLKVFISYSHDSPEHEKRVLELATRLSNDGLDLAFDRFGSPPPNWPRWMEDEMETADYVVVVCSQGYLAKVKGKVKRGTGKGVKWESRLTYQEIYDNDSDTAKYIPVLLEGGKYEHIPKPIRGGNHYTLFEEYEGLLRHLTGQPDIPKPKPGPLKELPPKKLFSDPGPGASHPWNVPPRNDAFTGREQILTDLRADLETKSKQALFGLGGVGKTQIAAEYAYRHREDYRAVLWSFADSEQSLRGGFAAIATLLDLPEKDSAEQAKATGAVKSWLEQNQSWLLVLDNADDPALLKPFLPQQASGHVLVTSRAHTFHTLGILSPREINVLSKDEAREFLLRRTGKDVKSKSPGADALAKELGYLPLALEQAGAYIQETGASFESYLASFKKQRLKLFEKQKPVLGNDAKEQQKRTITTTWSLNFADIKKQSPASADLLRLSAFLAPDAIPLELLEQGGGELTERLAVKLADMADNPLVLDELLRPLLRYSLIRRDEQKRTYSIHPLVQEVVREGLSKKEQKAWAERTVRALNAAFPNVDKFENWTACDRFLPHALACAAFINAFSLESLEESLLLNRAGYYLYQRAEYAQVEPLYRCALAIDEKAFGPEHWETATDLNNLAELYRSQGRYPEAEPLYRRALAIDEKVLGPEHPDTATNLNNLALLLEGQGKPADAEPLFRRALVIREKALGPEHPDTASSLNNLAVLLKNQGKPTEAEPLNRQALAIREKALGAEHPDTGQSLNNLALLLADQGKPSEAEPLYRRALAVHEKALGLEHPRTVRVRNNLIWFYRKQGRNAEADALEKEQ